MLATLAGCLALLLGLATMLLPLLAPELSRPRDSGWGALVLLLGLVLVTSADRLSGAPMLAVVCGGLLTGRLGQEVALGRWRQLSDEERQRLASAERWSSSLQQLTASLARLIAMGASLLGGLKAWLAARRNPARSSGKRWVRPEADPPAPGAAEASTADAAIELPAASVEIEAATAEDEEEAEAAEVVEAFTEVAEAEAAETEEAETEEREETEQIADPEESHEPSGFPGREEIAEVEATAENQEPQALEAAAELVEAAAEAEAAAEPEPDPLEADPLETVEAEAVEPAAADAPTRPALGRSSADLEALAALEEVAVEIDDGDLPDPNTREVRDFSDIDALLQAAADPAQSDSAGQTPAAGGAG